MKYELRVHGTAWVAAQSGSGVTVDGGERG
jgi:hypothetical protein